MIAAPESAESPFFRKGSSKREIINDGIFTVTLIALGLSASATEYIDISSGFVSRTEGGSNMNIVENYKLVYDGHGKHEVLGLAKAGMYASAARRADSKELAEYFLDAIRFDSDFRSKFAYSTDRYSISVDKGDSSLVRQIDHIHENCSREIRNKWAEPRLTDEEVADALFADRLEKELAKINGIVDVAIPL